MLDQAAVARIDEAVEQQRCHGVRARCPLRRARGLETGHAGLEKVHVGILPACLRRIRRSLGKSPMGTVAQGAVQEGPWGLGEVHVPGFAGDARKPRQREQHERVVVAVEDAASWCVPAVRRCTAVLLEKFDTMARGGEIARLA